MSMPAPQVSLVNGRVTALPPSHISYGCALDAVSITVEDNVYPALLFSSDQSPECSSERQLWVVSLSTVRKGSGSSFSTNDLISWTCHISCSGFSVFHKIGKEYGVLWTIHVVLAHSTTQAKRQPLLLLLPILTWSQCCGSRQCC